MEGKLEAKEKDTLIQFLILNPDLKEELKIMSELSLLVKPGDEVFKNKAKLYKEKYDSDSTFNYYAIANTEGDLSNDELSEFKNYLSGHPEKMQVAGLFDKTILQPDESIIFQHKNKLYRDKKVKSFIIWTSRIAAMLALLLLMYRISDDLSNKKNIADNNFPKVKKEKVIVNSNQNNTVADVTKESRDIPAEDHKKNQPYQNIQSIETSSKVTAETVNNNNPENKKAIPAKKIDAPPKINSRNITLAVAQPEMIPVPITMIKNNSEKEKREKLLSYRIKEKTGFDKIQLDEAAKAGLSLLSLISNDRVNFKTNNSGQITKLNLDTEILAVSIPVKNRKDK
jgi:hypothetical protein